MQLAVTVNASEALIRNKLHLLHATVTTTKLGCIMCAQLWQEGAGGSAIQAWGEGEGEQGGQPLSQELQTHHRRSGQQQNGFTGRLGRVQS